MTPEQRAEAVLQLIESDFGQSGYDVKFLAIRDEIVAAINETKEEDARMSDDFPYVCLKSDEAITCPEEIARKIRASKIKE